MNQNSFSPKARWDRFEPESSGFNPDALNERIEVLAYFKCAKIFPKSFTPYFAPAKCTKSHLIIPPSVGRLISSSNKTP